MMKCKAAIFDLDGTLLNTLGDLHNTMNRVLAFYGCPALTLETVRRLIGNGAREFMRLSLPAGRRDEQTVDGCLETYYAYYKEYGDKSTAPYPGIPELIQTLIKRNIPLAVLSNKPHHATVDVMAHYFPGVPFKVIFGQKPEYPPKPDITSAQEVARLLGFAPKDIAFIGDGDADALTAVAGGFRQAAVLWGFRSREELKAAGAKAFYEKPEELLGLFEG